jgi:predicted transcriptional regulator
MYKLTAKEEEIMTMFWERGPMFVREIVENYPAPRPHFNTVSTMVRALEERGMVAHKRFGGTFQYHAAVSAGQFRQGKLSGLVDKYFGRSYLGVVSALVRDEKIPLDELKRLIAEIEQTDDKRERP